MFFPIQRMKLSWVEDTTEYTPSKLTRERRRLGHEKVPHVVLYNVTIWMNNRVLVNGEGSNMKMIQNWVNHVYSLLENCTLLSA